MNSENLKIVIVGHVDHGKSTLIGRLLYDTNSLPEGKMEEIANVCKSLGKEFEFGYVLDNLEEERDQNVTIDTTQIFFKTNKRNYTIIDAPGHVKFVKNMITGASQAEAAILIIDAKEGLQEQTKRHSYLLKMLGIKQIIVAINKMDLVNHDQQRFSNLKNEIIEFLGKIDIKPSYIIPVSAREGSFIAKKEEKMIWYKDLSILSALDEFKVHESNNEKPLRYAVQDVYMYDKRIIAGRVESGILKQGQKIIVLPSQEETYVESIERFLKENVKEAESGECLGVITKDKVFVDRGYILCDFDRPAKITNEFEAHIFWMDKEPLKKDERLILRCSTQEGVCKIKEFKRILDSSTLEKKERKDEIRDREVADVTIVTETPIVVENFNKIEELGRFVLERLDVCAGGIITESR
jgi:sulfate adenylyltransferase large subunit